MLKHDKRHNTIKILIIDLINILCQQNKVNFTCITINATVSGDHCTLQRNKNIFIKKTNRKQGRKGMTFVLIRACQ